VIQRPRGEAEEQRERHYGAAVEQCFGAEAAVDEKAEPYREGEGYVADDGVSGAFGDDPNQWVGERLQGGHDGHEGDGGADDDHN